MLRRLNWGHAPKADRPTAAIARAFVKDMRAFRPEPNAIKRDEIASRQLHALQAFQNPREKKLRVHDVKEMFERMRN